MVFDLHLHQQVFFPRWFFLVLGLDVVHPQGLDTDLDRPHVGYVLRGVDPVLLLGDQRLVLTLLVWRRVGRWFGFQIHRLIRRGCFFLGGSRLRRADGLLGRRRGRCFSLGRRIHRAALTGSGGRQLSMSAFVVLSTGQVHDTAADGQEQDDGPC